MWEESRRLVNPQEVFVDLSDKLYEMKKELLKERITISSKLKSMKYLLNGREYECFEKNDCFYIPITDLKFFYTEEERLMQTSLTVKLKVDLLKGHMPENLALLKILFH